MDSLGHYTYLVLNLGTLIPVLALSFDKKVAFANRWKDLWPAMLIPGAVFLIWDAWFTAIGVWGFNDTYHLSFKMLGLPFEEWLFFLSVPYACTFVYTVLRAYLPVNPLVKIAPVISWVLIVIMPILGTVYFTHWYTFLTAWLLALWLLAERLFFKMEDRLGWFYLGYLVSLVPFLLVNGVLTSLPVVWYNNTENMAIRLGTIPIEDTGYLMLLLMMNYGIYEWKYRNSKKQIPSA